MVFQLTRTYTDSHNQPYLILLLADTVHLLFLLLGQYLITIEITRDVVVRFIVKFRRLHNLNRVYNRAMYDI